MRSKTNQASGFACTRHTQCFGSPAPADKKRTCRWKVDLYSDEVDASRQVAIAKKTRTKAIYELRKALARVEEATR